MLGEDRAQARKQYVEEVRRSFHQGQTEEYDDTPQAGAGAFWKVRLLLAVFIFAAFVLCDRTGSRFYNYSADEIVSMLKENQFEAQLDSIREAWNAMTE